MVGAVIAKRHMAGINGLNEDIQDVAVTTGAGKRGIMMGIAGGRLPYLLHQSGGAVTLELDGSYDPSAFRGTADFVILIHINNLYL